MNASPVARLALVVVAVVTGSPSLALAEQTPDFSREVRPILSQFCFQCHGPDAETREGGMRLDDRTSAIEPADSGEPPIVAGKPEASELIARIFSAGDDLRMPPPETNKTLSDEQKLILQRWIAAGAPYVEHWAFLPPVAGALPPVSDESWPLSSLDRFVLAKLDEAGLKPSPPADRHTLIRRVALDLTGLPPTVDEVDAFIADTSADAYQRLVDRLLDSPHYGERWARRWLDLARYADTNGYEKDRPRSIWPYRDWVINAFNADMPFDQFTVEQLAGDMLPQATLDQQIATGFHRNTMLNEEGGIDPLEFRFHAMTDRVATTGTTWLGLTIGCAQCHTHKYDPIPHREYFQFMAMLNNADEPELDIPRPELTAERARRAERSEQRIGELADKFPVDDASDDPRPIEAKRAERLEQRFSEWLEQQRRRAVRWIPLRPREAKANLPLLTVQQDDSVFVSGDITKVDTYDLAFETDLAGIAAVRLEVLPDERLPNHGPGMTYYEGRKGDFFLGEFQLSADGQPVPIASASQSYGKLSIGGGSATAANTIDGDPETGWSTSGREGEAHEAVYQLAEPLQASQLRLRMLFGRHYAASLGRFRISVTTGAGAEARDLPPEVAELLLLGDERLTAEQRGSLLRHFLLTTPELADARAEINRLMKLPEYPTTLIFRERPPENPRPTFIHHRGEFLQPTVEVEPGVLSMLHMLTPDMPANRLGLARWLVSEGNPLTARVAVNRAWEAFLGRGIVRTSDDFGFQGSTPTHPELLDWLFNGCTRTAGR